MPRPLSLHIAIKVANITAEPRLYNSLVTCSNKITAVDISNNENKMPLITAIKTTMRKLGYGNYQINNIISKKKL